MLDLKSILRTVLQQGLEDFGYGVVSVGNTPASPGENLPTITLRRSGAQTEDNRPLITLRRISGPRAVNFYLGNVATPLPGATTDYATVIMVEDRIRITIETLQDTGGQSLVDMLMLQIPTMLAQNWDPMTFPIEKGGYGLINATFRGSDDVVRTNEAGGKAVYTNFIDFTATLPMDADSGNTSTGEISYIEFDPVLTNVDPNNPSFKPV